MSAQSDTGYGPIRNPIDKQAVADYLAKTVTGFRLKDIFQFSFGQSNPTYLLTAHDDERQYVLRKKPPGKLVSQTAHAIEREYKIISALSKEGSVPVPHVYALCMDPQVLGTPFYVMEYLKGRIFTDVRMPEIKTKEERTACWMSIIDTIAALHKLDPAKVGLADYGSSKPFYPRQIRSLSKVSRAQAAVRDKETNEPVGDLPRFEFLLEWYSKHAPTGTDVDRQGNGLEGRIIHGDFKCDNMIFHPTEPRVIGVLDWELSTLGHPYSDLSNLLQPFYIPKLDRNPFSSGHLLSLRDIPASDLPIPDAETLLRAYCQKTDLPYPLPRWLACVSFAFFRLAVITQGIAARAAQGQASSAKAKAYAKIFPDVGQLAVETALGGQESSAKANL